MLKKIIQGGKWKILSIIFAAISLVSLTTVLSIELATGGWNNPTKEPVDVSTEYNDEYFDNLLDLSNQFDPALLTFATYTNAKDAPDGKTVGQWLVGIKMEESLYMSMYTGLTGAAARAKYFDTHSLVVPERNGGYPVVGVDLLSFRNTDWNTYQAAAGAVSQLKALYIPDSVLAIKGASFTSMTNLEYLRIPFVGTYRGSSGRGLNYTIQDVMKNGGQSVPTSDSFGSMFGTPFDYNRYMNSAWSAEHTDLWFNWTWTNDAKTTGTVRVVDCDNYLQKEQDCLVLGVRWAEISGEDANSPTFQYLLPRSLQKVIISNDTIIGNNAFTSCTARQIEIPDYSGSSLLFGNYAFSECVDMKEISLPTKRNVSFRKGTFNYCQSLEKLILPPGLTEIPDAFLYNALNLKTLTMPASIIGIGKGSFRACQNLEKIALYSANTSANITGDYEEDLKNGLVLNSSYDFNLPAALTRIGENAFQDCQNVKNLNIPATVQTIGYAAFGGCYNIETLVLPFIGAHSDVCSSEDCKNQCNVDSLGGDKNYHSLFGWIFGDSGGLDLFYIATQDYYAQDGFLESHSFYIPKTLKNLTIRGEKVISTGALQGLSSIINLTINEEVGNNVTVGALNGCANLQSLSISSIGSHLGSLFFGPDFENSLVTMGESRVPSTLKTIAVTNQHTIPTDAFKNCTRIENVTIGNNTQIMDSAIFYNNENLTTLTIPFNGYERGEFYRIYWWWGDKAIRNSVAWLFSPTYHPNTYENRAILNWGGYIRYIPNRLKSLTVTDETEIDTYSFRNFTSLESISITNVPDHMESYSFTGCSSLQELNLPYIGYDLNRNGVSGYNHTLGFLFGSSGYEGSYEAIQFGNSYKIPETLAIVKIGAPGREETAMSNKVFDQAFMNCKSITTIDFYNAYIHDLGNYAFANCTNLSQVNYPNAHYTHVGNYAFYNCPKVLAIEDFTPDDIRTIGDYSFYGTSVGIKSKTWVPEKSKYVNELILDKYTSVGDYAFGNCLQIEKVDIPATLTHIGAGLFSGCSYLEDVTLVNNKNVSPYMFEDCTSLIGIDLSGITSIPEGLLSGCSNLEMDTEYNNGLVYDGHTTYIGKYAFRGCRSLEGFVLNAPLQTIDEGAFQGCTGLEYMTIPRETTVINPYGWIGCNDNFFFYVYEPEEYWSKGWVNNWNCDYPVYVLGAIEDDIYTYVYDTTEKKFYITGLTPNATLNGTVTIPNSHNGIQVVGIDESRRTQEDIAAGAKDLKTQTGITKVILPKLITKIVGDPFQTGFRVDIYTELTKAEVTKIYNESSAALEKEYATWLKEHPNQTETAQQNAKINIFSKIKGWLPFTENPADGVAYATDGENSWDQRKWITGGFLYYKDYWQYGTGVTFNVPYLNINTFKYTLSNYDNHYTGNPIEQVVTSIQLPGELFEDENIGVTSQLLFVGGRGGIAMSPQDLLEYKYYSNVNVGTATLEVSVDNEKLREFNREYTMNNIGAVNHAFYFTGKTNLHYQIQKSKITVSSISGSIVQKEYDGRTYSYSTWATSEISGLEGFTGAVFSGRIETYSENVGLYRYNQSGSLRLYWSSPWRVTLYGTDITNNFDVEVKFAVNIVPMEVEIVWTKSVNPINGVYQPVEVIGTYETNGKTVPLVQYPYIGGRIEPAGVARNIKTGEYISNSLCPVTALHMDESQYGVFPYGVNGNLGTFGIYAYISGSAAKNYSLKEKQADGSYKTPELHLGTTTKLTAIQAAYRVGKGLITIDINETYRIPPTVDYWSRSWGFGGGLDNLYPINVTLNGLGTNSYFLGSIKTSKDALGIYTANYDTRSDEHLFEQTSDNIISWTNLLPGGRFYHNFNSSVTINYSPSASKPFLIYNPTLGISDETMYYDVVLNARIQILYNDFDLDYFIGPDDDEYLSKRKPDYEVFPRTITETTDSSVREYEYIEYMVDGKEYKLTVEDWNSFTNRYPDYEVNYYYDDGQSYGNDGPIFKEIGEYVFAVSISGRHYNTLVKNIRIKAVKSNVIVDSLSKVYDREPVDPLNDGKLLKIGEDQRLGITFTYYDVNGNLLTSAPKDVGTYSVRIYAPEGQYFNEYDRVHTFTISRRKVRITISGSKSFDQNVYSYTPLSSDYMRTDENPNEGLLPGDEMIGTIQTNNYIPGVYEYDRTGTYSFIWSPSWAVLYDVDNSDVTNNYELVLRGSYEIKPLEFKYVAEGYDADYDGNFHTGTVTILWPTQVDYLPALSGDVDIQYSVSSLSENSSAWLNTAPVFADPGEYYLYYKISATYFRTIIGYVKINIRPLTIEYIDPTTTDSDGSDQYWTVQYNARSYTYEIEVLSPEFSAVVYYSLDGSKYTTEAPMFINYGIYDVWYRIEAPYHTTVGPVHRYVRICIDAANPDDGPEDAKRLQEEDYYATFFSGEYDGLDHTVDADFTASFKATVAWTRVLYSFDGGITWTEEKPYYSELGRYLVTIKFSAEGYRDEMMQGYIEITGMQLDIQTSPYIGIFDAKYHMIYLSSNSAQIRFDETTKTYFYKNNKMDEEVELKFYYTTSPNVLGSNSGWLPTVSLVDGVPTQMGLIDVGQYAVYARIEADNFETLIIQEFTRVEIKMLLNPEISMDSPQQFEYSKSQIDSSKIVVDTIADGPRSYRYYSAYYNGSEMKYDEPLNRILPPEELGLYYVEVRIEASKNCGACSVFGFVEIVPRVLEVKYTTPQYYDGLLKTPDAYVVTGTSDVIHILSSVQGDKQPIDVGTYIFDVFMVENNPNYVLNTNTIEMEIKKRNLLFYLNEEHLLNEDGTPWYHTDSEYYDNSAQVGDNKWHMLGDLSGTRTIYIDGQPVDVTYSGLANNHAIYADLETSKGVRGSYFYSTIVNDFYVNSVIVKDFNIYQVDNRGNYVLDEDGNPISVLEFYDVDFYLLITLCNPDINLADLDIIDEYYYDGLSHTIQVNLPSYLVGAYIRYEGLDGYYPTPPKYMTVGEYVIKYFVGANGYEDTYGEAILKIRPAEIGIEVGNLYKATDSRKNLHEVYDDTEHLNDYTLTNILSTPMPRADHMKYYSAADYTYDQILDFYKNFDPENPIFNSGLARIKEAGHYFLVIYYAADPMRWVESYTIVDVELKQRDIIIEISSPSDFIKVYDGTKISIPLTNARIDMTRTDTTGLCPNHTINQTADRMRLYTVRTNSADAGVYDLLTQFEFGAIDIRRASDGTAVNGQNYHPVIHGDFTVEILKAYLKDEDFYVEDYTEKVYDGYRHEPDYTCASDGELFITYYEIEEETGNKIPVSGNQKNAGYYYLEIKVGEGKNYHSLEDSHIALDATGQPYFSKPYLTAEVLCTPKEVEVTWDDGEQTFTGEALSIKPWILDEETDHENPIRVDLVATYWDNASTSWVPQVINQGRYLSLAAFDTSNSIGQTYNRNYTLANSTSYFTIHYLMLKIQLGDGGETNDITYYNTQTPWLSYLYKENTPNAAEILADTPELNAWLKTVTISSLADDSLPATISARDFTPGTYRGERFDVNCRIKTKDGVDVTSSINFEIIGSITVKVDEIDFETKNVTLPYKENKNQSSVVGYTFNELGCLIIKNPKTGTTIENYVVNGTSYGHTFPNLSQAGEYDISFDIMATGYEACRASVHVTITPFPAYMTFATSLSKTYDGTPVDVSKLVETSASGFNGTVADLIITYFELVLNNGVYQEIPLESAPTDVGKYSVHVISSKDLEDGQKNYTTLDISQVFEITAKAINLEVNEDMELLNDELLNKAWTSKLYELNAGDNKYIMSGDMLQFQFSTDVFTRGNYVASQILKVRTTGIVEGSNVANIVTESGKVFSISWRLVRTDDRGNILYQELVDSSSDPDNPTMIKIPIDVSSNYYINLTFKLTVHYPYIPVTIEGEETSYDGNLHHGSIEFGRYVSADTTISYPAEWFTTNATQLYSRSQGDLTNNPDACATNIEALAFADPGSYTIYYKIDVKDSASSTKFESAIGSYVIRIDKLERKVVETQSLNKEFDNTAAGENRNGRFFPYFAVTHDDESIPDDYTVEELSIIYKQAGFNSFIDPEIGCIDSGVYMYSLTIPETKYYKQSVLQNSFSISKIRIYIEDKDFINRAVFTYDGLVKSVQVTENSKNYNVGTKTNADAPLVPLYGLTFSAVLITKDYKQKLYSGADSTLALFNYEYSVYDSATGKDVSNNYLIDFSGATIEIMPIPMQYRIDHPVYTYDNKDHAFSYYVSNPSKASLVHVEWYNEATSSWQTTPILKRDVGYHEVTIRMTAENYIPSGEIILPMTIQPAETAIEYVSNLSRIYDGNEVTIPEIIKTSRDDAHEGTLVDRYTYKYYKYDEFGNLIPEPIFTQYYDEDLGQVVTNGHRAVDVGKYRMEIIIPASANFEAATYADDFTISAYVTDVTWQNLTFTYDGLSHKPTAYLQLVPTDKQNGNIMNIQIDVTVTPNKNGDPRAINKGTYTATATLNLALSDAKVANYVIGEKTKNVTFTIQPRSTMIVLNYPQTLYKGDVDYVMYYDGLGKDGYKFYATNIVPNHKITDYLMLNYDGPRDYNKASDFTWMDGNLDVALASKQPRIFDENNVDVTGNYLVGYSYLFVLNENITDAAVMIKNYSGEYDGFYHTFDVELMVDDPSQFTIRYWVLGQSRTWTTVKPQRRDVGQDQVSVRIEDSTGRIVYEGTAGITIHKAEPKVEFEDLNFRLGKTYDGIPVENPAITYNGVRTTAATYTYYKINEDGSATRLNTNPVDAGRYRLDVEVPANQNYNGTVHSFDVFEITPRTITIHISSQTKPFDNLSWTHAVQDYEVENLVRGHTLRLNAASNNGILMTTSPEVGEYSLLGVTPGFQWQNNYLRVYDVNGNEVNGPTKQNYVVNLLANVTISERQFDVEFKNKIEIYDGTPKTLLARINGTKLPDGRVESIIYADFENEVKMEYAILQNGSYEFYPDVSQTARSGIGVYTIRVRISAPNYETLIKEAKLAIVETYDPDNLPPGFDDDDDDDDDNNKNKDPDDADRNPYLEYDKNKIYDGVPFPSPVFTLAPGLNHDVKYYDYEYYMANRDNLDPSKAISAPIDANKYVFVFKVSEDSLEFPGEEYHQAFRIFPRPVEAVWDKLTQKYTGDLANPLLPTAYYLDIDNNRVDCVVEPTTGFINKGTYSVVAKTNDTNYVISNSSAKFTISSNIIKDIVLLPPDEDYESGDPIILKDTDGNTYIRKEDFDKDPTLVKDPDNTYLVDENGELLKYNKETDTWEPAKLPFTMDIDDSAVDPETGERKVNVTISLKNPGDDSWEKNGTDDIKESFTLKPKNLPSDKYDLVAEYVDVWVYTGNPIEPEVTLYLRDLITNQKTELDPKHYTVSYNNNINVTTEDSKAEIIISSIQNGNYNFDDMLLNFTITATKPDVLELKDDALIQFINAMFEDEVTTIIEDGTYEHLAAGEDGFYLGHLHQDTLITEILAQFKNNPERLIVTDQNGEIIEAEMYEMMYFGSGFSVLLKDENEQIIDSVQGILYGDLDCDGMITAADIVLAQEFVENDTKFTDVESWYYFAGLTDREIGLFSAATIVSIQSYVNYGSMDIEYDFNTFDGTYPNSYLGTDSSEDLY